MKTILLVCDHSNIDSPLRRSLAHLVKCCEINIIPDGYQVFNELSTRAFDLIIIDFETPGADALELVESVQYIDPGVPVILLLKQEHKLIWDTARHLKAHPLVRPFKPLKFLRLVDKLLHKQLNRYRYLAEVLRQTLETLRDQTEAVCTFLVDQPEQPMLAAGASDSLPMDTLSTLALTIDQKAPPDAGNNRYGQTGRATLYVVPVVEDLRLALVASLPSEAAADKTLWPWLEHAAKQIKAALYEQAAPNFAAEDDDGQDERPLSSRWFLPLTLAAPNSQARLPEPTAEESAAEEDEIPVNWGILTNNTSLLDRLQSFCQVR